MDEVGEGNEGMKAMCEGGWREGRCVGRYGMEVRGDDPIPTPIATMGSSCRSTACASTNMLANARHDECHCSFVSVPRDVWVGEVYTMVMYGYVC